MNNITNISIPKPCHQSWQQMTPADTGRHCAQCCKTVTDFTAMSNSQIITYLGNRSNICGRFDDGQLSNLNNQFYADGLPATGGWKKLALLMGLMGSMVSFKAVAQKKAITTEQSPKGQSASNNFTLGVVSVPDSTKNRVIYGQICDENDEPLPGAKIELPLEGAVTQTDKDGNFKFIVPAMLNKVHVSSIGYMSAAIDINKSDFYLLKLNPAMMGEVVIVRSSAIKRIYYRCIKKPIRKIFN